MKKIFFIVFFLFLSQNVYSNTWTIKEYKDEFKGESVKYSISNQVNPNIPLDFPYGDMKVEFIKVCDSTNMILHFTHDPNLLEGELNEKEYSTFYVDVKLDGKFEKLLLRQEWGSKNLHIRNTERLINVNEFMIQLKHYGGTRHYKFNLSDLPC